MGAVSAIAASDSTQVDGGFSGDVQDDGVANLTLIHQNNSTSGDSYTDVALEILYTALFPVRALFSLGGCSANETSRDCTLTTCGTFDGCTCDRWGGESTPIYCDDDSDGWETEVCAGDYPWFDCDDFNASIYPGATEVCNEVDDNCDGQVDEELSSCPEACDSGEDPEEYSYTDCYSGDVYNYDECGNPYQLVETCGDNEVCIDEAQCEEVECDSTDDCSDEDICDEYRCCNNTDYYHCYFEYDSISGEYRDQVLWTQDCLGYYNQPTGIICDQDEDCVDAPTSDEPGHCE